MQPVGPVPDGIAVTISCDVGYKLTTRYLATCLKSLSYDVGDPSCIPITVGEYRGLGASIILNLKILVFK